MSRALFIVDVQNDFTEGGALGVDGGTAVAEGISRFLAAHDGYDLVVASRDWHDGDNDNGGHFSDSPDFVDTWPPHCVAGTRGAEYHPAFDTSKVDVHFRKGQGKPAYSVFEATDDAGGTVAELLTARGITDIDVVGLATDYCVRASGLDAIEHGQRVRVLADLVAGVHPDGSSAALAELAHAGAVITTSAIPTGTAATSRGDASAPAGVGPAVGSHGSEEYPLHDATRGEALGEHDGEALGEHDRVGRAHGDAGTDAE